MTSQARVTITPQLVIGVFIMLFGILLTLDRLHILDTSYTLRLWPAVLVVLGTWLVSQRQNAKSRFWGSVWILIGVWLLLNTMGLVQVGFWELVWPVAFIWLGVSLIRQTLERGNNSRTAAGVASGLGDWSPARLTARNDASGTVSLFAVMGESKRSVNDQPFRSGEMTAIMGGCILDLRQATIAPGEQATIDVFALMAGHEIWVPAGWTVVSHVLPFMGGVDDKRLSAADGAPASPGARPQLLLRGFVMMGGLVIKS